MARLLPGVGENLVATTLGYESREDNRARAAARWRRRLDPPSRAIRIIAWIGIGALFWGSAGLPGGTTALLTGIVLAPLGVVPILLWELIARPGLLVFGKPVPHVPARWWIVLLFLLVCAGFISGLNARAVAMGLRPVWVPLAEYYFARRPALAPQPNAIAIGPYILLNPSITPGGIRGEILGGGEVVISWSETDGYNLRTDPLR